MDLYLLHLQREGVSFFGNLSITKLEIVTLIGAQVEIRLQLFILLLQTGHQELQLSIRLLLYLTLIQLRDQQIYHSSRS